MRDRPGVRNNRCGVIAAALLVVLAACGSPQQLAGTVGPITGTTVSTSATPTSSPAPTIQYEPFLYDQAKGNTTGVDVLLEVPTGWPKAPTGTRYDFTSGGTLLRLDFSTPHGSALQNWQEEAADFASSHTGYKLVNDIHSINCPNGATGTGQTTDCADWEFTFTDTANGTTKHAIDRAIVVGNVGFAVYMSASAPQFAQAYKIFQHVSNSIKIGG
ncbi:MAG TPA: hypothetical protein VHX59_14190 [Mycobacteriales bacterium]|nr:hypothetical protein [Mycobacteriales bacterium]